MEEFGIEESIAESIPLELHTLFLVGTTVLRRIKLIESLKRAK